MVEIPKGKTFNIRYSAEGPGECSMTVWLGILPLYGDGQTWDEIDCEGNIIEPKKVEHGKR